MEKVTLGHSSLKVSRLTVGCWSFGSDENGYWGKQDQSETVALLNRAVEMGVNFFDTAIAYNDGASETALGAAMKDGHLRDRMIICDKIPVQSYEALPDYENKIRAALKRLQIEQLDLLLMHWPHNDKALMRANLEALQSVKEKGLVREIGISNYGVGQMEIVRDMGIGVCVNELAYNLMHRGAELAVLPYTEKHQIGIMAYMPLMQGILTGKYASIADIPSNRRRSIQFSSAGNASCRHGGLGMEAQVQELLTGLRALSEETGLSCAVLSTAWLLSRSAVSTILAGARNCAQLEENVRAAETRLPDDIVRRLDEISAPVAALCGANCDFWQWNSRVW